MNKIFLYLIALLPLVALLSCTEERDCSAGPGISGVDQDQLEADVNIIENFLEENNIEYVTHPSGIRYSVIESGEGNPPNYCSSLLIDFEGKLLADANAFHSRINAEAAMGSNFLVETWPFIAGLKIGITQMNRTAVYRIFIPSGLAFGEQGIKNTNGDVVVPANANIEYRVRLNAY